MAHTNSSQPSTPDPRQAVCGQRVGDRRVRVQRSPRSGWQRVSTLVRRVLADRT